MADNNAVRSVLLDPEFYRLKPSSQIDVLSSIDKEFGSLPLSAQLDIIRQGREMLAKDEEDRRRRSAIPHPFEAASAEMKRLGHDISIEPKKPDWVKPVGVTGEAMVAGGAYPSSFVAAKKAESPAVRMERSARLEGVARGQGKRVSLDKAVPPDMAYVGEGQYVQLPSYLQRGEVDPGVQALADIASTGLTSIYNSAVPLSLQAAGGLMKTLAYFSPTEDIADALAEVGDALERTAQKAEVDLPADIYQRIARDPVDDPTALLDPLWWSYGLGNVLGSALPIMAPGLLAAKAAGMAATAFGFGPRATAAMTALYGTGAASMVETLFDAGLQYREAIEMGASPEVAANVAVETVRREFPTTAAFNLAGLFNPAIKGAVKRALAGIFGEGLQEAAQGWAQRSSLRDVGGFDVDIWKPMLQEFLLAGAGGAALGPIVEGIAGKELGADLDERVPTEQIEKRTPLSLVGQARERIWESLGEDVATWPMRAHELSRAADIAESSQETAGSTEWDIRKPIKEAIELRRRYTEQYRHDRGELNPDVFLEKQGQVDDKTKAIFKVFGEPISDVRKRFAIYKEAFDLERSGIISTGGPQVAFKLAFEGPLVKEVKPTLRHRQLAQRMFGKEWGKLSRVQQIAIDKLLSHRTAVRASKRQLQEQLKAQQQAEQQAEQAAPQVDIEALLPKAKEAVQRASKLFRPEDASGPEEVRSFYRDLLKNKLKVGEAVADTLVDELARQGVLPIEPRQPIAEGAAPPGEPTQEPAPDQQVAAIQQAAEAPRKPTVEPAYGKEVDIAVPGEQTRYRAQYAVMELDDVYPSHNPFTFQPNPDYKFKNERSYTSTINAARVAERSTPASFDEKYLVTESPTGEHGAPIVDEEGNVLGGNSRVMILARVYASAKEAAERYQAALIEKADLFGIKRSELKRFKAPVLVRVVRGASPEHVIRDTNKSSVAALTRSEQAIADAKRVSKRTLDMLAAKLERAGAGATIAEALEGQHGRDVVMSLVNDGVITQQELALYVSNEGTLTLHARTRIGQMLVGRLFESADQLDAIPPQLMQRIERIAIPALMVERDPEWDLRKYVQEGVSAILEFNATGLDNIEDWLAQTNLEGQTPSDRFSDKAITVARKLLEGQRASLRAFRSYAQAFEMARGDAGAFFAPPNAEVAFEEAFSPEPEIAVEPMMSLVGPDHQRIDAVVEDFPHVQIDQVTPFRNDETLDEALEATRFMAFPDEGVLVVNRHGLRVLMAPYDYGFLFGGIAFGLDQLEYIQAWLRKNGANLTRRRNVADMLDAARAIIRARSGVAVVVSEPGMTHDMMKRVLREELAHVAQIRAEGHVRPLSTALHKARAWAKAAKRIREGYGKKRSPEFVASEVTVRLMFPEGWRELGLNAKEAMDLTWHYLEHLIASYGERAHDAVVYTLSAASENLKEVYERTEAESRAIEASASIVGRSARWAEDVRRRVEAYFWGLRFGREGADAEEVARYARAIEEALDDGDIDGALWGFERAAEVMRATPNGSPSLTEVYWAHHGSGQSGGIDWDAVAGRSHGGENEAGKLRSRRPGEPRASVEGEGSGRDGTAESRGAGDTDGSRSGVSTGAPESQREGGVGAAYPAIRPPWEYPPNSLSSRPVNDTRIDERIIDRTGLTDRLMKTSTIGFGRLDEDIQKHLYPYQKVAVLQMSRSLVAYGGALLADGAGTGKTAEILGIAKEFAKRGHPVLIISLAEAFRFKTEGGRLRPTGSYATWIEKLNVQDMIQIHTGKNPAKVAPGKITLATYNAMTGSKLEVDSNTLLIFDEAHALKNALMSKRGKEGLRLADTAKMVLYATATPYDRPQEIMYLHRLQPFGENVPIEVGMRRELGIAKVKTRFGSAWRPVDGNTWKTVRAKTAELWKEIMLSGRAMRRELRMDGVTIETVRLPMSPEATRAMNEIEANFGDTALGRMHQRRQIEPYKIPALIPMIKEELDAGRSVIVFVARVNWSAATMKWFDDRGNEHVNVVWESEGTAKSLKQMLIDSGIPKELIGELHGGAEDADANAAIDDFQAGRTRVLICTIEMGGTGLNLDDTVGDRPRTIFFVTAPFSALHIVQALHRGWRALTKSDLKVVYLRVDHPVDDWGIEIALNKMRTLGAVVKGDVRRMAPEHEEVDPEERAAAERMLRALMRRKGLTEPLAAPPSSGRMAMVADVASIPPAAEWGTESWADWLKHFHPEVSEDPVKAWFKRRDLVREYNAMIAEYSRSMSEGANMGIPWWHPYRSAEEAQRAINQERKAILREAEREGPLMSRVGAPRRFGRAIVLAPLRFLSSMVTPAISEAAEAVRQVGRDLLAAFAPMKLDKFGHAGSLLLRRRMAERARKIDQATAALEAARRAMAKMSHSDVVEFIDRLENGQPQSNPDLQAIADAFRMYLDEARDAVRALGTGKLEHFLEHYFPHIWKDRQKAEVIAAKFFGRRPLEGPKSFLKPRSIMFFKEGVEAGLEPVSWNPVDLVLMKLSEIYRYVMAHRFLNDLKARGLVRFVPVDGRPPVGWRKIIDPIGTVYGKPSIQIREAMNEGLAKALNEVIKNLGVTHERGVRMPKRIWRRSVGAAYPEERRIETQTGSAEQVIAHELGHIVDIAMSGGFKDAPGIWEYLNNYPGGLLGKQMDAITKDLRSSDAQTRKAAREAAKALKSMFERRKKIRQEMRALADERRGLKKYTHSKEEKVAAIFEAWVGARERMQEVAPTVTEEFAKWLDRVPELKPLRNIRGSLELEQREEEVRLKGLLLKGWWYAPTSIAIMLENHLRDGLRGSVVFRAAMAANNSMNMMQLSLSLFHLMNTTLDALNSQLSLALYRLAHGNVLEAARMLAVTPLSPVMNMVVGHKMLKAWYNEGYASGEIGQLVRWMLMAGGRAHMSDLYRTKFKQRMLDLFSKGNALGGLLYLPAAFVEAFSDFTMEFVVPRMKLGAFANTLRARLATMPPGAPRIAYAAAAAEAWDVVEDRLGEVVYDNYFWNRYAKDVAHLLVRSVGWNYGSYRVFMVGAVDLLRAGFQAAKLRKPDLSLAAAYLVVLPILTGFVGAILMYLFSGRWPELLEDYFFPQTGDIDEYGRPRRVSLPTYLKDLFHIAREPLKTAINKSSPLVDLAGDMLTNKDFYGERIRNVNDPFLQQLWQVVDRISEQYFPFGVRESIRAHEEQASPRHIWLPFLGMVPAPAVLGRTEAERMAQRFISERVPVGGRTKEQAERTRGVRALSRSIRLGKEPGPVTIRSAEGGYLTADDIRRAIKDSGMTPLQVSFEMLSLEEAIRVWGVANEQERRDLAPLLMKKLRSFPSLPPAQASRVLDLIEKQRQE